MSFSLDRVCWGYRDAFKKIIDKLHHDEILGPERKEITDQFFRTLAYSEEDFFDHVLHEFLKSLHPKTYWIMNLPSLFFEITEMGCRFAENRLFHGTSFFRILGEGGFGSTPDDIRHLMTFLRKLRDIDPDLAFGFLKGYRRLIDRLTPAEIERFIECGIEIYQRNKKSGLHFMEGTLKSSRTTIESLTRDCRLTVMKDSLSRLLRALVGREIEVHDIGSLDSDDIIQRGSQVVCLHNQLFLPHSIKDFADKEKSKERYLLMMVGAAGMLALDSFPVIHGHPDFPTCQELVGPEHIQLTLFQLTEIFRVISAVRSIWPGAGPMIDEALFLEREISKSKTTAVLCDMLLGRRRALMPKTQQFIRTHSRASSNTFETADRIRRSHSLWEEWGRQDSLSSPPISFLPDFLFPAYLDRPPTNELMVNLKETGSGKMKKENQESKPIGISGTSSEGEGGESSQSTAGYVYDEWNQPDADYFTDHCLVREIKQTETSPLPVDGDLRKAMNTAKAMFELLKPVLVRKEKRLAEGDEIDQDLLLDFQVLRHREPSPKINFYAKPRLNSRCLATLILIDVSGSTGGVESDHPVLEVEKRSALILGQALSSLNDKFAICGFSGQGRKQCEFYIFKDFPDPWDSGSIQKILAARPRTSTRIGAALRHAGFRLSRVEAKQRLIILITDGKPMDSGYDPGTLYAQHDVRMAGEENLKLNIHTMGISTDEHSWQDMQIMFPLGRYTILKEVYELPRILPRLYVRLTM